MRYRVVFYMNGYRIHHDSDYQTLSQARQAATHLCDNLPPHWVVEVMDKEMRGQLGYKVLYICNGVWCHDSQKHS